ncbi:MAG TPA: hypothetical protein PKI68_00645 [Pontiellaceae bacterium]|nr:hypothetical protein [Pontiellaceae bacterium]
MTEEITIKGTWWLPDNPGNRLSGEITYSPIGGARLSLYGSFSQHSDHEKFTVWGTTVKGTPVSLFDCYTKNVIMHIPGARVAEISSYFGVIGGHFKTPDDLKFFEITAELSHLHEWAWTTGIKVTPTDSGKLWNVEQRMLPDIPLGNRNGLEILLEFAGHLSPGFGDCKLSESCTFTVKSIAPIEYDVFEAVIRKAQHFIALGVSRPVYSLSIKARLDNPGQTPENKTNRKTCEIIRKLSLCDDTDKKLMPHDMQFCLGDLMPAATAYFERFFDKYQLLEPVCDLYFSTLYNPNMYVHQRFLALAHAVEAYHRTFIGGKYQSNDEYQSGLQKILWDAVPQTLDADFRASLKNKFKYLHEFSLRKRLQDIYGRFVDPLKPFLGEPTKFAGETSELRNMLTHRDPTDESRPEIPDWTEIWLKCEQLSLLLEVCLLHELGFSEQNISTLLPRNQRAKRIQLNRK